MQRQQLISQPYPPSRPTSYPTSWPSEEEGEFASTDSDSRDDAIERDSRGEPRVRLFPSVRVLVSMAVLGVALACAWRYGGEQSWSIDRFAAAFAAQLSSSNSRSSDERISRIIAELDALKKSVSDFGATQQQMAATIALLQNAQQELEKRPASAQASARWYSDLAALKLRIAVPHKVAGTLPKQIPISPTSAPPPSTRDAHRNGSAPLALMPMAR